jgi:hypothetical protein
MKRKTRCAYFGHLIRINDFRCQLKPFWCSPVNLQNITIRVLTTQNCSLRAWGLIIRRVRGYKGCQCVWEIYGGWESDASHIGFSYVSSRCHDIQPSQTDDLHPLPRIREKIQKAGAYKSTRAMEFSVCPSPSSLCYYGYCCCAVWSRLGFCAQHHDGQRWSTVMVSFIPYMVKRTQAARAVIAVSRRSVVPPVGGYSLWYI